MTPPLDFNTTLAAQLRDAGLKMQAMRKPQKAEQRDEAVPADTSPTAAPTADEHNEATQSLTAPCADADVTPAADLVTDKATTAVTGGEATTDPKAATTEKETACAPVTATESTVMPADTATVFQTEQGTAETTAGAPVLEAGKPGQAPPSQGLTKDSTTGSVTPHEAAGATVAITTTTAGHSPVMPDAASELWAMSQHSATPTLSERSWSGGVRGAVLDALRLLAEDKDHVLVNLKRLSTHTGISYGSVRNAMSRLTKSGDIHTRQIRMADGHGVRVDFLTRPGEEGTAAQPAVGVRPAQPIPSSAGLPGTGGHQTSPQPSTVPMTRGGQEGVHSGVMFTSPEHVRTAYAQMTALQTVPVTDAQQGTVCHTVPAAHTASAPTPQTGAFTASVSAPVTVTPHPVAASFWDTPDHLFAVAWPQVHAAGLAMADLRQLAPIFSIQGFDPAVLPRCLRYLDWELEHMQQGNTEEDADTGKEGTLAEARAAKNLLTETLRQRVGDFVRTMQRRGHWPRPQGYDDLDGGDLA